MRLLLNTKMSYNNLECSLLLLKFQLFVSVPHKGFKSTFFEIICWVIALINKKYLFQSFYSAHYKQTLGE